MKNLASIDESLEKHSKDIRILSSRIFKTNSRIDASNEAIETEKASVQNLETNIEVLQTNIENLQSESQEFTTQLVNELDLRLSEQMIQADMSQRLRITSLSTKLFRLESAVERDAASIEKNTQDFVSLRQDTEKLVTAKEKTENQVTSLRLEARKLQQQLNQLSKQELAKRLSTRIDNLFLGLDKLESRVESQEQSIIYLEQLSRPVQ